MSRQTSGLAGWLCIRASPANRGSARGSLQCRQREVIYVRFRGEGKAPGRGLSRTAHSTREKSTWSPAGRTLVDKAFCNFCKVASSLVRFP